VRTLGGCVTAREPGLSKKPQVHDLPEGLERQIVALVGRRGRGAFLREAVRQEIERQRVLKSAPKNGRAAARDGKS
jgi:predicted transcriptional regulator